MSSNMLRALTSTNHCADQLANSPANATADVLDAERFSDPFANPVADHQ